MINRRFVSAAWLVVASAALALGQTQPAIPSLSNATAKKLDLTVGRGQLLQYGHDVKQVVTSEPKIADVVVISPREVMVNAKAVGKTTVIVWDEGNPVFYDVDVLPDTTEFDSFRLDMATQLPGSEIIATGKGDTIILTGTAKDSTQVKRAAALAQSRAKTVVNMITAPPDADPRQIVLQVKFAALDRSALTQLGFNLFSRNGTLLGEATTQQFQSPRFSQLQFQNGSFSNASVNFADLLNFFVFTRTSTSAPPSGPFRKWTSSRCWPNRIWSRWKARKPASSRAVRSPFRC